jgi:hypothetical protein
MGKRNGVSKRRVAKWRGQLRICSNCSLAYLPTEPRQEFCAACVVRMLAAGYVFRDNHLDGARVVADNKPSNPTESEPPF